MKSTKTKRTKIQISALLTGLLLISVTLCGYRFSAVSTDWMTSSTGSAKYLDGSTVLVSLFIEDPSSTWTDEKKELVMSKMDIANDFLVTEGASYGKSVNLIYNIYEHPDLNYTVSYSGTINDSDSSSYHLLDYVTNYIDENIPTQDILSNYGVDSIGYMCFLDKSGVSYTFPYYEGDSDLYYYETCFMFLKCDGDYEPPAVYAHEMLHLFGARDLYATNEPDGITKDFVQHIETDYPNEIMLTTYDENWNNVQDHVSNDLTDITAYFIGWVDDIPELDTYPSIYYPYPASFGDVNDDSGDYSDYQAGDSDNSESHWGGDNQTTGAGWGTKSNGDSSNSGNNSGWSSNNNSGTSSNTDDKTTIWEYIWSIFQFWFD